MPGGLSLCATPACHENGVRARVFLDGLRLCNPCARARGLERCPSHLHGGDRKSAEATSDAVRAREILLNILVECWRVRLTPKVLLEECSNVLCLTEAACAMLDAGMPWATVALFFVCAHQLRNPDDVKILVDASTKWWQRHISRQRIWGRRHQGWRSVRSPWGVVRSVSKRIAPARAARVWKQPSASTHFGTACLRSWCQPHQARARDRLESLTHHLENWALGTSKGDAQFLMHEVSQITHMKSYSFGVVRAFEVLVLHRGGRAMVNAEAAAANMRPHVTRMMKMLTRDFMLQGANCMVEKGYWTKKRAKIVIQMMRPGMRALNCCELWKVLVGAQVVVAEEAVSSDSAFFRGLSENGILFLNNLKGMPVLSDADLRREGGVRSMEWRVLDSSFPRAKHLFRGRGVGIHVCLGSEAFMVDYRKFLASLRAISA